MPGKTLARRIRRGDPCSDVWPRRAPRRQLKFQQKLRNVTPALPVDADLAASAREETAGLQQHHRRIAFGSHPTPQRAARTPRGSPLPAEHLSPEARAQGAESRATSGARTLQHVHHAEQPIGGLRPRATEPSPEGPLALTKRLGHPPLRAGAPAGQVLATVQEALSR